MEKTARFTYYIQASQGNAQGELSLSQLVKWMLDAATSHAESWGVGYSTLIQENRVWVLARLGVEMDRFPVIGDTLVIETWVEGYNPHFSARNFCFTDLSGSVLGYARTIWSVTATGCKEYAGRGVRFSPLFCTIFALLRHE